MDNPFESPENRLPAGEQSQVVYVSPGGMARQVPIVAVLLIVQGGLEGLVGVAYAYFAFIERTRAADALQAARNPRGMTAVFIAASGAMALVALVSALVKVWAGCRNYTYRGRTLGVVALLSGFASCLTLYCAPTSISLAIYGLIVYLNGQSAQAFALRQEGMTVNQIAATLG